MLPPSSVWLSKSPKVEAPSTSTAASRSSAGWPLEIATLVLSRRARRGSRPSPSIAAATLSPGGSGPAPIRAKAASSSAWVTASSPTGIRRPYGVPFSTSGIANRAAISSITA